MTTWAILATGESMNQQIADFVKGKCKVMAVSNAYELAPWADGLASNDSRWWRHHKAALDFKGGKYCAGRLEGVKRIAPDGHFTSSCNSGLFAMRVAEKLGATKILLLGFDMRGTHYFGNHPAPLRNTTQVRFKHFIRQFDFWKGCEVINCTKGSALKKFPFHSIESMLAGEANSNAS